MGKRRCLSYKLDFLNFAHSVYLLITFLSSFTFAIKHSFLSRFLICALFYAKYHEKSIVFLKKSNIYSFLFSAPVDFPLYTAVLNTFPSPKNSQKFRQTERQHHSADASEQHERAPFEPTHRPRLSQFAERLRLFEIGTPLGFEKRRLARRHRRPHEQQRPFEIRVVTFDHLDDLMIDPS